MNNKEINMAEFAHLLVMGVKPKEEKKLKIIN